jgi:hypothetical protein
MVYGKPCLAVAGRGLDAEEDYVLHALKIEGVRRSPRSIADQRGPWRVRVVCLVSNRIGADSDACGWKIPTKCE